MTAAQNADHIDQIAEQRLAVRLQRSHGDLSPQLRAEDERLSRELEQLYSMRRALTATPRIPWYAGT